MLEEELKNRIATKYFKKFDCDAIVKRIDFCVSTMWHTPLLWAEAKQSPADIYKMLAQLLLTIKQDVYDNLPPKFLGCFDNEKIAFVQYYDVLQVFNLNDFNWTQTPSAVDDKTVEIVKKTINTDKIFTFNFNDDEQEIHNFISENFKDGGSLLSTLIDKNNFIFVYQKWHKTVMPYINADWKKLKENYGIYDRDFFLAELNIDDNDTPEVHDDRTAYPDFYITFNANSPTPYMLKRTDGMGLDFLVPSKFKNGGLEKYIDFWKRYKRPPKNMYWNYIINRLDLLVPQDVRERKGAFFTPQIWVEKSQIYLANYLGENWQEEYYIWDCCAGTGNLLNGFTNEYHIFASTLDQQDVEVMKDRVRNGANLLENHIFQFDFLNDDFNSDKVPEDLKKILSDPEKRKKLVIYINPPYKEATTAKTVTGTGTNKSGVAILSKTYQKYGNKFGKKALMELFAQFYARIYEEIPSCTLAAFSTLKVLQSINFVEFRNAFKAKLKKMFLVPADTFDNVNGKFPIGFYIWDCGNEHIFSEIQSDVFDKDGNFLQHKFISVDNNNPMNLAKWIRLFSVPKENAKGLLDTRGNDFQNQKYVYITSQNFVITAHSTGIYISESNLLQVAVYLSVRHIIPDDWLNDRDQFLYPNDGWKKDLEFLTNCLVYSIFHKQNKVSSKLGVNHWIPFSEREVNSPALFDSHFMHDFLNGKIKPQKADTGLFADAACRDGALPHPYGGELQFSDAAQSVLAAGREVWKYYFTMADANTNASFYDIKEYFQGRNDKGKMNATSNDTEYNRLMDNLKEALRALGEEIKPKVYEYGFLK